MQNPKRIHIAGLLLVVVTLAVALPGCGGGQQVGPDGTTEMVKPENPAPGDLEPETGLE